MRRSHHAVRREDSRTAGANIDHDALITGPKVMTQFFFSAAPSNGSATEG
jgi:hypothetical protein